MSGLSAARTAYEQIKTDIIACTLAPGQMIIQPQLASEYRLGVTPVREALQRLAHEGLVRPIPRFGYIVAPVAVSDVREIFELRTIVETAAARLAAERATDDELRRITQAADFAYVYKDPQTYSDFLAHNADFHRSVAAAAHNGRLCDALSPILDEMTRMFHLGLNVRDSADEMRQEHLALARCLAEHDVAGADSVVREQIARSQQRVVEALMSLDVRGAAPAPSEALVLMSPSL